MIRPVCSPPITSTTGFSSSSVGSVPKLWNTIIFQIRMPWTVIGSSFGMNENVPVVPDDVTKVEISRSGKDKIIGSFKLCVSDTGAIASVTQGNEDFDKVLDQFSAGAAKIGAARNAEFQARLRDFARGRFDLDKPHRGEAVMFIGSISRDPSLREWEKDVAVIRPSWDAKSGFLAVAPADSKLVQGRQALIVGVIAGVVTGQRGEQWLVLDRVAAVPFHSRNGF